jgi:hypothetical protein
MAAAMMAVVALSFGSILPLTGSSAAHLAIGASSTGLGGTTGQPTRISSAAKSTTTATATGVPSTSAGAGSEPATSTPGTTPTATPTSTLTSTPGATTPTSTPGTPGTTTPTSTPATTTPTTTTQPTTTTSPTTSTSPPPPPVVPVVPAGCGAPAAPAVAASPARLRARLVGTWVQCGGQSIFGPHSGDAVEILANGTWVQLQSTPAGWLPLHGKDDSGIWQVLPPATADPTVTDVIVRFAVAPATTASSPVAALTAALTAARTAALTAALRSARRAPQNPQEWTVRVMLTAPPHVRGQFLEGALVTNYRWLSPATARRPRPKD